jgi:glycosyltransferase involved in cell wall biosynthesis
MRVLLVTHYYDEHGGGVEIVAGELARRLARRGLEIVWAASEPVHGSSLPNVARLPMRTWNVTEQRLGFPYPLWGPVSLWRLGGAVRRCDAVHLHDSLYLGNLAAYLCARWWHRPVVVTQHIGTVPYSRRLLRWLHALANRTVARLVLGGRTCCVFISPKVRDYFAGFIPFRSKPVVNPNGVAQTLFHPIRSDERQQFRAKLGWPADQLVMLFVGRFVEKKGLALLRELAGHFRECTWVFVGWGPDDPSRWGLPNVRCPGRLKHAEVAACYQAADLLVLPSVGEGFPLVVQEAMACGTPALISADTAAGMPGIETAAFVADLQREKLMALVRGLVVSPAALQARRDTVADYARRYWDWERSADRYERLFAEVSINRLGRFRAAGR